MPMRALVVHAAKDLRTDSWQDETPGPGQVLLRTAAGGICGSDLHYYHHGGFGTVRLKQPMVLGHEVSGRVAELGWLRSRTLAVRIDHPERKEIAFRCDVVLDGSFSRCIGEGIVPASEKDGRTFHSGCDILQLLDVVCQEVVDVSRDRDGRPERCVGKAHCGSTCTRCHDRARRRA